MGPHTHITSIEEPDSAGHFGWRCTEPECNEDASGYETAAEVMAAATAHGPVAVDSFIPVDVES